MKTWSDTPGKITECVNPTHVVPGSWQGEIVIEVAHSVVLRIEGVFGTEQSAMEWCQQLAGKLKNTGVSVILPPQDGCDQQQQKRAGDG